MFLSDVPKFSPRLCRLLSSTCKLLSRLQYVRFLVSCFSIHLSRNLWTVCYISQVCVYIILRVFLSFLFLRVLLIKKFFNFSEVHSFMVIECLSSLTYLGSIFCFCFCFVYPSPIRLVSLFGRALGNLRITFVKEVSSRTLLIMSSKRTFTRETTISQSVIGVVIVTQQWYVKFLHLLLPARHSRRSRVSRVMR